MGRMKNMCIESSDFTLVEIPKRVVIRQDRKGSLSIHSLNEEVENLSLIDDIGTYIAVYELKKARYVTKSIIKLYNQK